MTGAIIAFDDRLAVDQHVFADIAGQVLPEGTIPAAAERKPAIEHPVVGASPRIEPASIDPHKAVRAVGIARMFEPDVEAPKELVLLKHIATHASGPGSIVVG